MLCPTYDLILKAPNEEIMGSNSPRLLLAYHACFPDCGMVAERGAWFPFSRDRVELPDGWDGRTPEKQRFNIGKHASRDKVFQD